MICWFCRWRKSVRTQTNTNTRSTVFNHVGVSEQWWFNLLRVAFGELALWFDQYVRECLPRGDWIFRSRLTYGRCFRQSVFELVTCLRLHAEGEVHSPVMLASLNHYFLPWIMCLFSHTCCHIHVHSLVSVSLPRIWGMGGEGNVRFGYI